MCVGRSLEMAMSDLLPGHCVVEVIDNSAVQLVSRLAWLLVEQITMNMKATEKDIFMGVLVVLSHDRFISQAL